MTLETEGLYRIVRNHEEQYSIYPSALEPPPGWTAVGVPADRQSCLATIETLWQDLRPKSLRDAMAAAR